MFAFYGDISGNPDVSTLMYLYQHRRSQEFVLGGLATEAARSRRRRHQGGREWGGGVPLPSRLLGLGERRNLPQRGPGRPNTNFGVFTA